MNEVSALFPNFQIPPGLVALALVAVGVVLASKFPILTRYLPAIFKPSVPQEEIEKNVAKNVSVELKQDIAEFKAEILQAIAANAAK